MKNLKNLLEGRFLKRRRKLMSILMALYLLATLLVPMATPAAAGNGAITALTTPTVSDTTGQTLGIIKVVVPAGSITSGDSVIFKLAGGYDFGSAFNGTAQTAVGAGDNRLYVPATIVTDVNGLAAGDITITVLDANDEVQLTATADQSLVHDFIFYIYLRDIDVTEDTTDDCVVTFDGPAGSGFPTGTVTVAYIASTGNLTLSVSGADTSNNVYTFDLRVKEDVKRSLEVDTESIKLILPNGYGWQTGIDSNGNAIGEYNHLWGDDLAGKIDISQNGDGSELYIDFAGPLTDSASAFELKNLRFTLSDESMAHAGDIILILQGESNVSPSTLVAGRNYNFDVMSTFPVNGAQNVPVNTDITITFWENIKPGDSAFRIALCKNGNAIPITYGINGSVLTLYPANDLEYSVSYAVYLPEKAVENYEDISFPDSYSFSFTTVNSGGGGGGGGASGGGRGTTMTQSVNTTSRSASITPSKGGTVGLGSDVSLKIPANALQGSDSAQVAVQKVDTLPAVPSGFMVMGAAYQFTVDGQDHYSFNQPVTLTFNFDPAKLALGQTPAVYYFDEAKGQWINLGGTVNGNIITAMVDHLTTFAVFAVPEEQYTSVINFKDIQGHWAEQNINKLVNLGIINGYPDGTFKPDEKISRAEMTAIIIRTLDYISTNKSGVKTLASTGNDVVKFTDNDKIPDWAKGAVIKGAEKGIVKGYPDGSFRPRNDITRAEATFMILQLLDNVK